MDVILNLDPLFVFQVGCVAIAATLVMFVATLPRMIRRLRA